jgi:hypothetical protein
MGSRDCPPEEPASVTLQNRMQAELTAAMKSGDVLRRDTLRMVVAALYNAEKAARQPLADDDALRVLAREVKTRRESIGAYTDAGRHELAEKEQAEAAILGEFLPDALTDDQLRAIVLAAIEESGASSARDIGRVMGLVAPRIRGRADGKAASAMVAQELARRDLAAHGGDAHL